MVQPPQIFSTTWSRAVWLTGTWWTRANWPWYVTNGLCDELTGILPTSPHLRNELCRKDIYVTKCSYGPVASHITCITWCYETHLTHWSTLKGCPQQLKHIRHLGVLAVGVQDSNPRPSPVHGQRCTRSCTVQRGRVNSVRLLFQYHCPPQCKYFSSENPWWAQTTPVPATDV